MLSTLMCIKTTHTDVVLYYVIQIQRERERERDRETERERERERQRELSNQLTVNQPTGSPNHQPTHQVANETQASVYLVAATNSISWSGQTMTKLNERGVVAMVRLMEVQTDKSWQTEGAVEKTSTSRSYCSRKGTRLLTTSMYHFLGVIFCQ